MLELPTLWVTCTCVNHIILRIFSKCNHKNLAHVFFFIYFFKTILLMKWLGDLYSDFVKIM